MPAGTGSCTCSECSPGDGGGEGCELVAAARMGGGGVRWPVGVVGAWGVSDGGQWWGGSEVLRAFERLVHCYSIHP